MSQRDKTTRNLGRRRRAAARTAWILIALAAGIYIAVFFSMSARS